MPDNNRAIEILIEVMGELLDWHERLLARAIALSSTDSALVQALEAEEKEREGIEDPIPEIPEGEDPLPDEFS